MPKPPTIVATFSSPERAKSGIAALERSGLTHGQMRVLDSPSANRNLADADRRALGWLHGVARRGAALGAVVGAVMFLLVIAWWKDGEPDVTWLLGSLGGAAAGALVGAMIAVGVRAPRAPAAWDVHLTDASARPRVAITMGDEPPADVIALLQGHGATVDLLPPT